MGVELHTRDSPQIVEEGGSRVHGDPPAGSDHLHAERAETPQVLDEAPRAGVRDARTNGELADGAARGRCGEQRSEDSAVPDHAAHRKTARRARVRIHDWIILFTCGYLTVPLPRRDAAANPGYPQHDPPQ